MRDNVIAPFLLLYVVIVSLPKWYDRERPVVATTYFYSLRPRSIVAPEFVRVSRSACIGTMRSSSFWLCNYYDEPFRPAAMLTAWIDFLTRFVDKGLAAGRLSLRPRAALQYTWVVGKDRRKDKGLPDKTFPQTCYGSDIWYPKCDVLVPPRSSPIPYSSTTSYLPSH